MDSPVYQGVVLIVVMVSFLGIWVWAWSHRRKDTFREASMRPLEEDNGVVPDRTENKD